MSVFGRGGINIASKSEISSGVTGVSHIRAHAGLDFWYGTSKQLDLGLSANWFETFSRNNASQKSRIMVFPVLIEAKFSAWRGLYAGAGVGISPGILTLIDQNTTIWGAALGARVGYDYNVTKSIVVGVDNHIIYLLQSVEFAGSTSNTTSSVTKGASQANFKVCV